MAEQEYTEDIFSPIEEERDGEYHGYWAKKEDPDELVKEVEDRVKSFYRYLRSTGVLQRVIKNWRYYHGIFNSGYSSSLSSSLKEMGEQGEKMFLGVNHFRNLLQHLLTLTTQNRPSFETLAVNSDTKSMEQARLGDDLLEYYLYDQRIEVNLKAAVEHSLVFGSACIATTWDKTKGKEFTGDEEAVADQIEQEQIIRQGDLRVRSYSLLDCPYDPRSGSWQEKGWCCIRDRVLRWDLCEQYPEIADHLKTADSSDYEIDQDIQFLRSWDNGEEDDYVDKWTFFHEKCESLPYGRMVEYVGGKALPGTDGRLPYRRIPVDRCAPGEFLLTSFGYTPAFDLQGLQQALNAEMSAVCTNHRAFGVQNVWVRTGSNVSVDEIQGGLNLVQSIEKPEPLNLTFTPEEVYRFADKLREEMEYISGVNSVARGQPEASLKSGSALALIDSKAVQFASALIHSYYMLLEDVGTSMLRVITDFAGEARIITIQGKKNRRLAQRSYGGQDLARIDRVRVQAGNLLGRTLAGRVDQAKELLQAQKLGTPQEFFNVIETGRTEELYESEKSQLNIIHEENEGLMAGQPARALITDNHVLHVREHTAVMNTTELRTTEGVTDYILAHVQEHMQLLSQPGTQQVQAILGYESIQPPMAPPPMPVGERAGPGAAGRQAMGVSNNGSRLPKQPRLPQAPAGASSGGG